MIISTKRGTPAAELDKIIREFEGKGLSVTMIRGTDYNVFGLVGDTTILDERLIRANPYVENVQRVSEPYKKANRLFHEADTVVDVAGVRVGGTEKIVVIGGPCSIESEEQAVRLAQEVKAAGGRMLRGGAYKPRTSPYAFQGLGTEGILDMAAARRATGLPIVSELMSADRIDEVEEYVDLGQIGARNMQNFQLLKEVGKMSKPVLLKRGLANTIEEWIMSAEYIMAGGNENVIFCERGIRTFEKYTRNTLDLCREHEPRGHRGGRGRPDHRGARQSRGRVERRRAEPEAGQVRRRDRKRTRHRPRRRPGFVKAGCFP